MAKKTRKGFFDLSDGKFKGKGIDALDKSRASRSQLIALFGGKNNLPSSIMKAERTKTSKERDKHGHERSYSATSPINKRKDKKQLDRAFDVSGRGCGAGALSTFPQNIGRSMVTLYSAPGDTIFDPFAGHNSRMELCVRLNRNYIGCDLSRPFMRYNRKRAMKLRRLFPNNKIQLVQGDSRRIRLDSNIGDMTITSPPYYDIEYYGDEAEQMSNYPTYQEFLTAMWCVMSENFRILKPGAYAAWFINDFRRKGKFHSYHSDIIRLGIDAGFIHHDTMITDFGRGFRDIFISQTVEQRILPKRHEYGIIFLKPKETKNGKTKSRRNKRGRNS